MKLRNIKIVYLKELLDTIRDRRTLMAMVVVPILLFPVIMGGFAWFAKTESKKMVEAVAKVAVVGRDNAPRLYQRLEHAPLLKVIESTDPRQALTKGEIEVVLEIPGDFELKVGREQTVELTVVYDAAVIMSGIAKDKVCQALEIYKKDLIAERLEAQEIPGSILTPFGVQEQNVAPPEKMTGMVLGMILPYLVILMVLTGAMYPAIDLTAGEKERGTIETLLVSPTSRFELVAGKFLTVFTASITSAILATISMYVSLVIGLPIMGKGMLPEGLTFTIQPGAILVMLLLLVPVAMLFSALLMSIAIFARSYKEAQAYITPLTIVVVIPAVIPMMALSMKLTPVLACLPIINTGLILKEVFTGVYQWGYISLIFLSSAVYATIALFIATCLFQREKVLFRT